MDERRGSEVSKKEHSLRHFNEECPPVFFEEVAGNISASLLMKHDPMIWARWISDWDWWRHRCSGEHDSQLVEKLLQDHLGKNSITEKRFRAALNYIEEHIPALLHADPDAPKHPFPNPALVSALYEVFILNDDWKTKTPKVAHVLKLVAARIKEGAPWTQPGFSPDEETYIIIKNATQAPH